MHYTSKRQWDRYGPMVIFGTYHLYQDHHMHNENLDPISLLASFYAKEYQMLILASDNACQLYLTDCLAIYLLCHIIAWLYSSCSEIMLESCISLYKSFPSRVLSPTPANKDKPPCSIRFRESAVYLVLFIISLAKEIGSYRIGAA